MALTFRTNGSGAANVVGASWWDDYFNLLTGVMTDQPVTLSYSPGSSTTTPTLIVKSNGNAPLLSLNNGSTSELSVDASGNLSTLGGITTQGQLTAGLSTSGFNTTATAPVIIKSWFSELRIFANSTDGNWSFVPNVASGGPRGMLLYTQDTGGALHQGLLLDAATGFCHLAAKDGGSYRLIAFYEGTGTPTGQNEGDIWFDG